MKSVSEERAREILAKPGTILAGHFVGTSRKHINIYVAKDRATRLTSVASELCSGIAMEFASRNVDVVVSPALGGIALSQWTAHHLTDLRQDRDEVLAVYAEHEEDVIFSSEEEGERLVEVIFPDKSGAGLIPITQGQKLVVRKTSFVLKRGFAADVKGKRVLLVEDILTTGGSARASIQAVNEAGGILVGVGVLANVGKVTAEDLGADNLVSLIEIDKQVWTEDECSKSGLCAEGVKINTDFGHGKEFLERKAAESSE